MIPFLVQKGLSSSADEVSKFSLSTILKICKQAGSLLRSHIPTIVIALLDGLTTMEPQLMSVFYKKIVVVFRPMLSFFHTYI
jgi:proteasome component ECM29